MAPTSTSPLLAPEILAAIDSVIEREGPPTNDPLDKGGRTAFGVAEASNPTEWADGEVTLEEARDLFTRKYVKWPGFDRLSSSQADLQAQLIDFGVNSGPQLAIQRLQALLGVEVDGVLGPQTLEALQIPRKPSLNNQLVASRVRLLVGIVKRDPSQLRFLAGWVERSLSFLR